MSTEDTSTTAASGPVLSEELGPLPEPVHSMPATLAGRCTDGRELGRGTLVHAVDGTYRKDYNELHGTALCGAKPGRRSVGWSVWGRDVTCQRCLHKMLARGH